MNWLVVEAVCIATPESNRAITKKLPPPRPLMIITTVSTKMMETTMVV